MEFKFCPLDMGVEVTFASEKQKPSGLAASLQFPGPSARQPKKNFLLRVLRGERSFLPFTGIYTIWHLPESAKKSLDKGFDFVYLHDHDQITTSANDEMQTF